VTSMGRMGTHCLLGWRYEYIGRRGSLRGRDIEQAICAQILPHRIYGIPKLQRRPAQRKVQGCRRLEPRRQVPGLRSFRLMVDAAEAGCEVTTPSAPHAPPLPRFDGGTIVPTRAVLAIYVKVQGAEMTVTVDDKTDGLDEAEAAMADVIETIRKMYGGEASRGA
jgi:hypothetical protein